MAITRKKVNGLCEHSPQLCSVGIGIKAHYVAHTLLFSVGSIANNANRNGVIDIETIPPRLNLIEVPEVPILAIVGINIFSRLFRFAHVLLSFVQNVAYFHL